MWGVRENCCEGAEVARRRDACVAGRGGGRNGACADGIGVGADITRTRIWAGRAAPNGGGGREAATGEASVSGAAVAGESAARARGRRAANAKCRTSAACRVSGLTGASSSLSAEAIGINAGRAVGSACGGVAACSDAESPSLVSRWAGRARRATDVGADCGLLCLAVLGGTVCAG